MTKKRNTMEHGPQPLDTILNEHKLKNSDLVEASTEQLTHKMAAKGRKGRELTLNVQNKILRALNAALPADASVAGQTKKVYQLSDLFNYQGR